MSIIATARRSSSTARTACATSKAPPRMPPFRMSCWRWPMRTTRRPRSWTRSSATSSRRRCRTSCARMPSAPPTMSVIRAWRNRSGRARTCKAAWRDAVNHADDPDLFDHHVETGINAIRQQAKIDNVSDKMLGKQLADYKSGVHADTIDALPRRDPMLAANWYAQFGDQMNDFDRRKVEGPLEAVLASARGVAATDSTAAKGISDNAFTETPIDPAAADDATASALKLSTGIAPGAIPELGGATPAFSDDMGALSGADGTTGPNGHAGGYGAPSSDPRHDPR